MAGHVSQAKDTKNRIVNQAKAMNDNVCHVSAMNSNVFKQKQ